MSSTRSSKSRWSTPSIAAACGLALAALLPAADARAFAGFVSPPRYELRARPGDVVKQVLEVGNDSDAPDEYALSTADWLLNAQGGVEFREALQPGSCRTWVRIERRSISLGARSMRKFRFEVHVPADAPAGECRFAIVVEKAPTGLPEVSAGNIRFPLQGRIGVIVYVAVGEVAPKLELRSIGMADFNGRMTPAATFHNAGNSHGRPEGVLEGVDAAGRKMEFVVSSFPILPGETRAIAIWPQEGPDKKPPEIAYPLRLRGTIEWDGGKRAVDSTLR